MLNRCMAHVEGIGFAGHIARDRHVGVLKNRQLVLGAEVDRMPSARGSLAFTPVQSFTP